jgi:hypothetical protein
VLLVLLVLMIMLLLLMMMVAVGSRQKRPVGIHVSLHSQLQIGVNRARAPDADRRAKLLIHLAMEESLLDAYSH